MPFIEEEVTDPKLIAGLEKQSAPSFKEEEVTDPKLISELDSKAAAQPQPSSPAPSAFKEEEITDPRMIAQLETAVAPPQKQSYVDQFSKAMQDSGLFASLTSAQGTGKFNELKRKPDGDWDLPILTPITKDTGAFGRIGAAVVAGAQKLGAGLDSAGMAIDKKAIQGVFHKFQQDNNLSDSEMNDAYQDFLKSTKSWDEKEPYRVFSNGEVAVNPMSRDFLDPEKVKQRLDESGASPAVKARYIAQLPQMQQNVAANRLQAYEAAASVTGVEAPSAYAVVTNQDGNMTSPEFIRSYEQNVLDKQGKAGRYAMSLGADLVNGFAMVANTGLGIAATAGSKSAGDLAGQIQEASNTIQQGKEDTGIPGQIVQQIPSVITQAVAAELTGGLSTAALGARGAAIVGETSAVLMAGGQSAGLAYAQARAEGKSHEEAQTDAIRSGTSTAIITGIFSAMGAGGTESAVAGHPASEVTLRDLFKTATKQELWQGTRKYVGGLLKSYAGEASEEAIDQFTQDFLTADPDSNLGDAWKNAWNAGVVGGWLGVGSEVAMNTGFGQQHEGAHPTDVPMAGTAVPTEGNTVVRGMNGEPLETAKPGDLPPPNVTFGGEPVAEGNAPNPAEAPPKSPTEQAVNTLLTPETEQLAPASVEAARDTAPASVANPPELTTTQDNATGNREIKPDNQPEHLPTDEGRAATSPSSSDQPVESGAEEKPTTGEGQVAPLDATRVAEEFKLTPEQADHAVRVATALGLSPETVLVGDKEIMREISQSDFAETTREQNNDYQKYIEGNWGDASAEQRIAQLERFTDARLRDLGATEESASERRVKLGDEFARISLRGSEGGPDTAKITPEGDVVITLRSGVSDLVSKSDNEEAAIARKGASIDEEVIHAAALLALKKIVGPSTDYKVATEAEADRILKDTLSVAEDSPEGRAVRLAVMSTIGLYRGKPFTSEELGSLNVDSIVRSSPAETNARILHEVVRQVVQLRNSGEITETVFEKIANIFHRWVHEYLGFVKDLAAKPGMAGDRFQRLVSDTENLYSQLNTPYSLTNENTDIQRGDAEGTASGLASRVKPDSERENGSDGTERSQDEAKSLLSGAESEGRLVPKPELESLKSEDPRLAGGDENSTRYQGPKGSTELTPEGKALIKGLANPDFTTAMHEMMHAVEMTGFKVLADDEVATIKAWAGSKTEGRAMMERSASEKLARGWENYLATGRAPLQRLQAVFDKIAKWMLDTYGQIKGSKIDVKLTPELQSIFDKIASRIEAPSVVYTKEGDVALHNENGEPLPPAIPYNPEAIHDGMSDEEAEAAFIGMVRHIMENPPEAPPTTDTPPEPKEAPPAVEDWNPEGLYSLQNRRAREEAARYNIPVDEWMRASRAFEGLWENAVQGGEKAANELISDLSQNFNPDRVLKDQEVAILTHEGLRRKGAVDTAIKLMQSEAAKSNPALMKAYEDQYSAAWKSYKELQDFAAMARTASGRALNAWRYALRDDFSYATLQSTSLARLNAARVADGKLPLDDLPKSERDAIAKFSERMTELQGRIREMQEASAADKEGYEARLKDQEALIQSLLDERKAANKRTAVSDVTKRLLVDKVRKAAAEARARLKEEDPNIRFQSAMSPETDPRWYDRVLVLAEPLITEPAMSAAKFADMVKNFFGDAFANVADRLRTDAERHINKMRDDVSGKHVPTPNEVMETAPPEVTRDLVYDLARAHIYEGARKTEVMDKVTDTLKESFPDVTRDQVSQLFTDYGRQRKMDKSELATALRDARALELVQKQIDDLEARGEMKRTGARKDEPSTELRQLRKKRDDLAKKLGYSPVDPETGLSSAQHAARKRMENEIAELQSAIDSGNPRVRVTRGVEYTEDMNVLKEKLQALRAKHEEIFGQERTPEERAAMVLKDLDRRIEQERQLINEGLLKRPSTTTPLADTPEIAARREQLKKLKQQKFELYDAAHPGERALAQAMKAAQDAVARREAVLQKGLAETPARRQRGEGVTPTEDLKSLWEAADAMDVLVREMRRNRPLTPAQEQVKLDRAYQSAVDTREALRAKLASGDLSVAPKTQAQAEARTRAVREESATLRKQLIQMQKDAGVGPFSQDAKESRKVAILEKRIAEIRRQREQQDFAQKPRPEPVTSEQIRKLEAQKEREFEAFENARAAYAFSQLSLSKKAWSRFLALYQARMMMNLTGDFGIFERQLGKVNFYLLANDLKNYITRKVPELKQSSVARVLKGGIESFMHEEAPGEVYHYYKTHPDYPAMRAAGFQLVNPHETSFELTSTGDVRMNPLNVIGDRLMAALMIGKGLTKMGVGMIPGMPTQSFASGLAETIKNIGLAVAGRRFAIRVERAQNAMLNIARWETATLALTRYAPSDFRTNPKFAQDVMRGVMMSSGKIAGNGPIASFLREKAYPLSFAFAFLQHRVSNFQATFQLPVLIGKMMAKQDTRPQAKALLDLMAHRYAGQAIKMVLASLLFGTWREEEKKKGLGVVLNPYNPKFGQLRVGQNTYLDFNSGSSVWLTDAVKMLSDTKLDPNMLNYGVERKVANTPWDKKKAFEAFTEKILNPNVQTALQFAVFREMRQGGPLQRQNFVSQMDLLTNEIVMNLTARDFENITDEHGPAMSTALFSLLMIGDQININESPEKRAARKAEERMRLTLPPTVITPDSEE